MDQVGVNKMGFVYWGVFPFKRSRHPTEPLMFPCLIQFCPNGTKRAAQVWLTFSKMPKQWAAQMWLNFVKMPQDGRHNFDSILRLVADLSRRPPGCKNPLKQTKTHVFRGRGECHMMSGTVLITVRRYISQIIQIMAPYYLLSKGQHIYWHVKSKNTHKHLRMLHQVKVEE